AAGSLQPTLINRLKGQASVGRRYLTLEADRAVDLLRHCVPEAVAKAVSGHWAGPRSTSPGESLHRALNGERIPEAPLQFGVLRPREVLRGVTVGAGAAPTEQEQRGDVDFVPT